MEGRFPKGGLYVAFMNCGDSSTEGEMNAWYNEVHVSDVTRAGIFHNATRYMNPEAQGTNDDPRYLAIYETDREDVARAYAENKSEMERWIRPWSETYGLHPAISVARRMLFRRHGRTPIAFAGCIPRGLILRLADCLDPEREAEFNWWYDYRRCFDILLTSAVTSASRYRNVSSVAGEPRYLALYETESDGHEALRQVRDRMDRSKGLDIAVTRYSGAFNLIFSESSAWARSGV